MNLELLLGTEVWQQTNLKLNQFETEDYNVTVTQKAVDNVVMEKKNDVLRTITFSHKAKHVCSHNFKSFNPSFLKLI